MIQLWRLGNLRHIERFIFTPIASFLGFLLSDMENNPHLREDRRLRAPRNPLELQVRPETPMDRIRILGVLLTSLLAIARPVIAQQNRDAIRPLEYPAAPPP